jgi:hypothetical protein
MHVLAQVRGRVPHAESALQGSGRAAAAAVPEGWAPAVGDEVAVLSMPASATGRVLSLGGGGSKGKATVKAGSALCMPDSIGRICLGPELLPLPRRWAS